MLYDRLTDKKELQLQLYIIMQNPINEMRNNGIIASFTGDAAKAVAKQFIPTTMPVPSQSGLSYLATLNYDPRCLLIPVCGGGDPAAQHSVVAMHQCILYKSIITDILMNRLRLAKEQ